MILVACWISNVLIAWPVPLRALELPSIWFWTSYQRIRSACFTWMASLNQVLVLHGWHHWTRCLFYTDGITEPGACFTWMASLNQVLVFRMVQGLPKELVLVLWVDLHIELVLALWVGLHSQMNPDTPPKSALLLICHLRWSCQVRYLLGHQLWFSMEAGAPGPKPHALPTRPPFRRIQSSLIIQRVTMTSFHGFMAQGCSHSIVT